MIIWLPTCSTPVKRYTLPSTLSRVRCSICKHNSLYALKIVLSLNPCHRHSYERILTNSVAHFDARSVERMKQIFEWVAFSKRPLRKIELRSALAFNDGDPRVNEIVPSYVFDMCAPLIEICRDTSFAFIHVSVKENVLNFLTRPSDVPNSVSGTFNCHIARFRSARKPQS